MNKAMTLYDIEKMKNRLMAMDARHREKRGRHSLDEIARTLKALHMLKLSTEIGALDHCFEDANEAQGE